MADTPRIRVIAGAGGTMLSHPRAGMLRDGVNSWPADQFTFRRIAEGSLVKVEDAPAGEVHKPETKRRRRDS